MARLIDADKYPCRDCTIRCCHTNCAEFRKWLDTPVQIVQSEPIIHCDDCVYCMRTTEEERKTKGFQYNPDVKRCGIHGIYVTDNFYCGCGCNFMEE